MPASFDETQILERLRGAERVSSPNPRVVRVARDAYLASAEPDDQPDLDEATRAVVDKLGGRVGKVQTRAPAMRAGHQVAGPPQTVWFYELPFDALKRGSA